jgi:hypothetical protein
LQASSCGKRTQSAGLAVTFTPAAAVENASNAMLTVPLAALVASTSFQLSPARTHTFTSESACSKRLTVAASTGSVSVAGLDSEVAPSTENCAPTRSARLGSGVGSSVARITISVGAARAPAGISSFTPANSLSGAPSSTPPSGPTVDLSSAAPSAGASGVAVAGGSSDELEHAAMTPAQGRRSESTSNGRMERNAMVARLLGRGQP